MYHAKQGRTIGNNENKFKTIDCLFDKPHHNFDEKSENTAIVFLDLSYQNLCLVSICNLQIGCFPLRISRQIRVFCFSM